MASKTFAPYVVMYNDDSSWSLKSLSGVADASAIFFAFGNLTGSGNKITVDMGNSSFEKFYTKTEIIAVIAALKAVGKKAILSINDSADGSGQTHWSDINTTDIANAFASNVAQIVTSWGFSGVDLDNEDFEGTSYFNIIVPALRTALGSDTWISAPVYQDNEENLSLDTNSSIFNSIQTMNYDGDIGSYAAGLIKAYPALSGKILAGIGTPDATNGQSTPLNSIAGLAGNESISGFSLWAINYSDADSYVTAIQNALNGSNS